MGLRSVDAQPSDSSEYTAEFFNACGSAFSAPAAVSVKGPACRADFNHDGTVNSTDVSDFINAWFAATGAGCGG